MKKMLKQFGTGTLLMLSICGTKVALAGERGGNGADVIICDSQAAELLDTYEARELLGKEIDLSLTGTYPQLVEEVISRIKMKDYERGQILQGYWDDLKFEISTAEVGGNSSVIQFTTDKLAEISDEMRISIPQNCYLQQLVIQIGEKRDAWNIGQPRFTVQKQIWDTLNHQQKAATIMHELWYRYFLSLGESNSLNTRAMNAIFITNRYSELSFRDYYEILKLTSINKDNFLRFSFKTPFGFVRAYKDYQVEDSVINGEKVLKFKNLGVLNSENDSAGFVVSLYVHPKSGEIISFWLNQIISQSVKFGDGSHKFKLSDDIKVFTKSGYSMGALYHPNGKIKVLFSYSLKKVKIGGVVFKKPTFDLFFDENGQLLK